MFSTLIFIFLIQAAFPAHAVNKDTGDVVLTATPPPTPEIKPAPTKPRNKPPSKQPSAHPGLGKYYRVKPGETLYRIGVNTGVGHKKLAEWNGLPPDYLVKSGQTLQLFPSHSEARTHKDPKQAPTVKTVSAPEKKVRPTPAPSPIAIRPLGDSIKVMPIPESSGQNNRPVNKNTSTSQNSTPITANKSVRNIAPVKSLETDTKTTVKDTRISGQLGGTKKPKVEPKKPRVSTDNKSMLKLNFQWPLTGVVLKNFSQSKVNGIGIASRMDKQSVKAAEAGKVVYQGPGLENYPNLIVIKHSNDFVTVYANNSRILVKDGENIRKGQAIAEILAASSKQKPLHFEIRKAGRPIDALAVLPAR